MVDHGDSLFIRGSQCAEHITTLYPDIDPILVMEPQDKTRFLKRKKKAESQRILVEELPTDDSASDFGSGDDDDGGGGGCVGALIVQPEALVTEIPRESGLK